VVKACKTDFVEIFSLRVSRVNFLEIRPSYFGLDVSPVVLPLARKQQLLLAKHKYLRF